MQKYKRKLVPPQSDAPRAPNHFRVASRRSTVSLYVKQAEKLLNRTIDSSGANGGELEENNSLVQGQQEDRTVEKVTSAASVAYYTSVSFTGMGRAMHNAIIAAETVKRRVNMALHQNVAIRSTKLTYVFEPLGEGLDVIEQTKDVPVILVTLSSDGNTMNKQIPGYQSPGRLLTIKAVSVPRRTGWMVLPKPPKGHFIPKEVQRQRVQHPDVQTTSKETNDSEISKRDRKYGESSANQLNAAGLSKQGLGMSTNMAPLKRWRKAGTKGSSVHGSESVGKNRLSKSKYNGSENTMVGEMKAGKEDKQTTNKRIFIKKEASQQGH